MEYQPKPGAPAIVTLGAVQILSWGGSFYLMAVMANPIIAETGWSQQWVYGALSLGILVSGLLAPLCGRLIARAQGRRLLAASGAVMALGLVIMALSHNLPLFLFAWLIIGAGMAMGLYDALFATLGTLYGGQARGAITGITLISGFCTSLVWPGIALLIHWLEWRGACLAIAALLCLAVLPAYLYALPAPRTPSIPKATQQHTAQNSLAPTLFWLLCSIFTLASVIMTAISVQLITLLQASGHSLSAALAISTLLGPCQVASRIVDMAFKRGHPIWTTFFSVGLVALGLLLLACYPAWALVSMVLYGAGNGLRAIVRGTLPLAMVKPEEYAIVVGRMARPALIGQALTPLIGGYIFQHSGAQATLWLLCALALINVLLVVVLKRKLPAGAPESAG
ncbi:MFS transporter [Pantoea dispersa]|uniref:MFS transporter n=1 Tax=Pantoea dispersa TaxID=59814 RepID=UPI000735EC3F|nr:MFS transporter [Pantoea dispersa]KTR98982.1 MFS transporter [Pantoea dispersa]KTS36131.1 MFS transporter [Pantoea dispersa]KTS60603.1 MFS transporter [Pantoea dispersa]QZY93244.1 MFS transporter [Pantoea dispersa]RVU74793.1 MFS transporter [Pantoea dispersa]